MLLVAMAFADLGKPAGQWRICVIKQMNPAYLKSEP